jgi:hypothetical protein
MCNSLGKTEESTHIIAYFDIFVKGILVSAMDLATKQDCNYWRSTQRTLLI